METTFMTPFPFYNGAYWIDNSTIEDWLECNRQYEYSSIRKRVNVFNKAPLNYGKAMHTVLATLELLHGNQYTSANMEKLTGVLRAHFEASPQPPDDHRQLALAVETLRRYVTLYEVEPWKIADAANGPLIERVLYTKLTEIEGIPLYYYGLLDLGVRKPDGFWVVDHKTTSMLGSNFDYDMAVSNQFRGYMWLVQQVLGVRPTGYIINAIRTLSPSPTAAKSPATLDKWWSEQFRRLPFYADDDSIAEWHEQVLYTVDQIRHQADRYYPPNRKSCVGKYGRCQYYDICTLPRSQRLIALNSNNFNDNNWTEEVLNGKI